MHAIKREVDNQGLFWVVSTWRTCWPRVDRIHMDCCEVANGNQINESKYELTDKKMCCYNYQLSSLSAHHLWGVWVKISGSYRRLAITMNGNRDGIFLRELLSAHGYVQTNVSYKDSRRVGAVKCGDCHWYLSSEAPVGGQFVLRWERLSNVIVVAFACIIWRLLHSALGIPVCVEIICI